jgi:hypothetical protein
MGIGFQNISKAFPARSEHLMEPRMEGRFDCLLVHAAFEAIGKHTPVPKVGTGFDF